MTLRIVIAEDSFLVREGVRQVLDHQPDLEVVGVCGDLPGPTSTDEGTRAAVRLAEGSAGRVPAACQGDTLDVRPQ